MLSGFSALEALSKAEVPAGGPTTAEVRIPGSSQGLHATGIGLKLHRSLSVSSTLSWTRHDRDPGTCLRHRIDPDVAPRNSDRVGAHKATSRHGPRTPYFLESPLSWDLEPVRRILVFMYLCSS